MAAFPRRAPRLVLLVVVVVVLFLFFRRSAFSSSRLTSSIPDPSFDSSSVKSTSSRIVNPNSASTGWSNFKPFHPPKSITPLPLDDALALPPVQADKSAFSSSSTAEKRRAAVRDAFKKSYASYKDQAWMRDELRPLTGGGKDTFGGWAATLVDSLDTLWIMDLKDEFQEASVAVDGIDWMKTDQGAANMFETTIRHLGGLLSAYDLSGNRQLLRKAIELADMLYVGFDTPNRLPGFWLNFDEARQGNLKAGTDDPAASPASLCVEFTRLAQITGDAKYYDATDRVTRFLEKVQMKSSLPGMWPIRLDFRTESVRDHIFTLGALVDSLYEYLPKMHALMGGIDESYEKMYRTAMDVVIENLLFRPMLPNQNDILFTGDYNTLGREKLNPESQHLTCFAGGMFGLGGRLFNIDKHVSIGEKLARGCGWAYKSFPTGLMPEIFGLIPCPSLEPCPWDEKRWTAEIASDTLPKGFKHARDPQYQLRPEAIESIFILYRITAKPDLQDVAWDMFQSIINSTETELANAAIKNVNAPGETAKVDSMESFWMAETLKYFYLIFSPPDVISLDEYVFNTEAHPLRRPRPHRPIV